MEKKNVPDLRAEAKRLVLKKYPRLRKAKFLSIQFHVNKKEAMKSEKSRRCLD